MTSSVQTARYMLVPDKATAMTVTERCACTSLSLYMSDILYIWPIMYTRVNRTDVKLFLCHTYVHVFILEGDMQI